MSDLLRRAIGETVTVEVVLAGGLWKTAIDPNQLENVILNLAVNARDAMPDGGKLTIETANTYLDEAYAIAHGRDVVRRAIRHARRDRHRQRHEQGHRRPGVRAVLHHQEANRGSAPGSG